MEAFLISLGVVFVAELGDKSQLMAMTFATRFRALPVLGGIAVATCFINAVSVAAGGLAGTALPEQAVTIIAGVLFFGFAIWTLLARGDAGTADGVASARSVVGRAFVVGAAYFMAELGDKTMFATMVLASRENPFGTWLGATTAMVASAGLAVVIGRQLGKWLPERAVRYVASGMFAVFGILLLLGF